MLGSLLLWLRSAFLENFVLKVLALALSVTLVLVKREEQTTNVVASVRVELNFPSERVLMTPRVDKVKVTLEGDYNSLRRFDADSIAAVNLNLSGYEEGQVTFDPEGFRVPPGLKVREVRPAAMVVRFEGRLNREVPIVAKLEGEPLTGYRVTEARVEPSKVLVSGAESVVNRLSEVKTSAISMIGRQRSATIKVPLAPPPIHTNYASEENRVDVHVVVEELRGSKVVVVEKIAIDGPAGLASAFEVRPAKLNVTLGGTVGGLAQLEDDVIKASVSGEGLDGGDVHTRPVIVQVPSGIEVSEIRPSEVTLVRLKDGRAPDMGAQDSEGVDSTPEKSERD